MQLLHMFFLFFQNFCNFTNFHAFHNCSTESACSHQLSFSRPANPSFWQTVSGQSNLYQTWYGVQWFCWVTTRHDFSAKSGFTKNMVTTKFTSTTPIFFYPHPPPIQSYSFCNSESTNRIDRGWTYSCLDINIGFCSLCGSKTRWLYQRTRPRQSVPNSGFHLVGPGLILVNLV